MFDTSLVATSCEPARWLRTFCDEAPLDIQEDASDALIVEQLELEVA
jgi:hypothetical protein